MEDVLPPPARVRPFVVYTSRMPRRFALILCLFSLMAATARAQAPSSPAPGARWFKGNTHAHTLNSDGDSAPDAVARWYREARYHFLVVTDHNFVTPVTGLNDLLGAEDRFLVISGEEITDRAGNKPVHVNALGATKLIEPRGGSRPGEAAGRDVEAARAAGSVSQINHPNFGWALTAADLMEVDSPQLLEIFNGHPAVNNLGGGDAAGAEALWDELLTAGRVVYGVASDDPHELKRPGHPQAAGPGRGWVMVRADRLSADRILAALARGDFYSSTGVELADWQATPRGVSVKVKEQGSTRYRVQFIGKGGRLLRQDDGAAADYGFTGSEGYVRVKITDSNGLTAWTQPAFVPVGK